MGFLQSTVLEKLLACVVVAEKFSSSSLKYEIGGKTT